MATSETRPHFSLVLATVGRVDPVKRFLKSMSSQEYPTFEILVADQNPDERLEPVLDPFRPRLNIRRLRAPLGLSRARNTARRFITGEIIGFPDDDCTYPPGLLDAVARALTQFPELGGIAGCPVATETGDRFRGFGERAEDLTHNNVWRLSSSIGLFLRREVLELVGDFDETLGLGSGTPWSAAEDRDYPLRAIDLGVRIRYEPSLTIEHPAPDYCDLDRAYGSGASLGRVLRRRSATRGEVARLVLMRPIGGMVSSLLRGRWKVALFYLHSLRGRISGWRAPIA